MSKNTHSRGFFEAMDLEERRKFNLKVLQRHDPEINGICDQSSHAAVYEFDPIKREWTRMGFEGALFLVQRRQAPEYALFMLNRQSVDNYQLYLNDFVAIEFNGEFLIYYQKDKEGRAYALWLYEERDRQRMLDNILRLRESMSNKPSQSTSAAAPQANRVDILELLKKATIRHQSPHEYAPEAVHEPMPPQQQQRVPDLLRILQGSKSSPNYAAKQPNGSGLMPELSTITNSAYNHGYNPTAPINQSSGNAGASEQSRSSEYAPNKYQTPGLNGSTIVSKDHVPFNIAASLQQSSPMLSSVSSSIPNNGQLTKPFYHTSYGNASPQKTASLLQALQSGSVPPSTAAAISPMGYANVSPLTRAPPLTPHQLIDPTLNEINRRIGGEQQPVLSKPEFIQQFMNIIQNDSTFLDTLYDQYRRQQGQYEQPAHVRLYGNGLLGSQVTLSK